MSAPGEYGPADAASRNPVLLLLVSGLAWLVVAGALGLLASVQLLTPAFLADCPVLTYGRVKALAETAFLYGWLANAGLGVVLWVLGRLAGEPLRAQGWALGGAAFWNLGVTWALVGIAAGDTTGYPGLGLPGYVHLVLFFSYGAVAVAGILAWSGRLRRPAFASHWYGAAALFLFPWLLSIAHVMLFSAPVRGVLQAIVAGWYVQSTWGLWIAPLALAGAYYVVPKVTGRVIAAYEFASLGFWTLILVSGLTAGRSLVGGPVPAWLPALAVVTSGLLLFHTMIVLLNLKGAFGAPGIAAKFIAFGLGAYTLHALASWITLFHGVAVRTQFTYVDEALGALTLYGAASTLLFGAIYYALPRVTGKAWLSGGLVRAHLVLSLAGITALVAALAAAGLRQGSDLLDPSVGFDQISAHARSALGVAAAAQAALLLGNVLFLLNFSGTVGRILSPSAPAAFAEAPPAPAAAP